jgi:hypothetical protein
MKKIHGFLDAIEQRFPGTKTPGYVCAVVREDVVVLERAFGYANLEWDARTMRDTLFHIGSETKQFTACIVMRPVEPKADFDRTTIRGSVSTTVMRFPTRFASWTSCVIPAVSQTTYRSGREIASLCA